MSILAECPFCRRKQATKNKLCFCGADLDKLKRSKKIKYWISYRLSGGKQRRELVGYSIEEARAADGKRRVQKKERRIFDMLPEADMTFDELAEWYLGLEKVKALASFARVSGCIKNFNEKFGNDYLYNLKPSDLENYQSERLSNGVQPATVDMEVGIAKTMVRKAFENDKVSGDALKPFMRIKKTLRKGSNARKRLLTPHEYLKLIEVSPPHLRAILIVAAHTGMRKGELRQLRWSHIDPRKTIIQLPASITKDRRPREIPINHHVREVLEDLQPQAPKLVDENYHDFVFTYQGKPISHKDSLKKSFETACNKAEIQYGQKQTRGLIFRDIRRTVKTGMLEAGLDKAYRDVLLGHSLKDMDVHYLVPTKLQEAMDEFTRWFDQQIANVDQSVDQKVKRTQL